MRTTWAVAGIAGLIAGTPVMAQYGTASGTAAGRAMVETASAKTDIANYLCTFAGKCSADADSATPMIAAPRTKGFHLATARGAAPAPQPAAAPRGYRGAAANVVAPARDYRVNTGLRARRYEAGRVAAGRYTAPAYRPITPGAVTSPPRADLMLNFAYNSAALTLGTAARTRTFAQALLMDELKGKRFLIEGHTDARGPRDLNLDLSRRRAQTVADYLVTLGVDRSRIEVKGIGPDQPLPGRSAKATVNRRVEAVLLS